MQARDSDSSCMLTSYNCDISTNEEHAYNARGHCPVISPVCEILKQDIFSVLLVLAVLILL